MTGWNLTGKSARPRAATDPLPWERDSSHGPSAQGGAADAGTPGATEDDERDPHILTVTQAVGLAGATLAELPPITVLGEVSGFRGPYGARGHCYFQIKDEASSLECIIWGGVYKASPYELRNGLKMRFTGKFEVYARTGKMSFQISRFEPVGEGLLRQQVAALAEKLRREGLMDEARKRPIPAFCTRVAVVTSLSGAVIDDVKRTLRRRNPLVELICVGSKVQGEGAEAELIDALGRAARIAPAVDCILHAAEKDHLVILFRYVHKRRVRPGDLPRTQVCDGMDAVQQRPPEVVVPAALLFLRGLFEVDGFAHSAALPFA